MSIVHILVAVATTCLATAHLFDHEFQIQLWIILLSSFGSAFVDSMLLDKKEKDYVVQLFGVSVIIVSVIVFLPFSLVSDYSSELIRIAASRRHFAAQVNINKFLSSFV